MSLGGEEFLIILDDTELVSAIPPCERLRLAVAAVDRFPFTIAVSLGVASTENESDKNALIKRADQLMYLAKERGRNQVCSPENHHHVAQE